MLVRFRVRERNYLQNLRGPRPTWWFFVACTNRLISVQLKTLNSSTELLALDSLVLVGQKRDPDRNRVVLCSCAGFVLPSADPSSLTVEQFPHLLIGNLFRMVYAGNDACFPEAFYKCSNSLFAWSEILENGLLCGGVRRK